VQSELSHDQFSRTCLFVQRDIHVSQVCEGCNSSHTAHVSPRRGRYHFASPVMYGLEQTVKRIAFICAGAVTYISVIISDI